MVGYEQQLHFRQLLVLLRVLGRLGVPEAAEVARKCAHVSYGHVQGLSTRRGDVVLVDDVLCKAREHILQRLREDNRVTAGGSDGDGDGDGDLQWTADVLALSTLVVQDLKAKRVKNYSFSWERVLDSQGDTGVFLQYTHARLCSIERGAARDLPAPSSLQVVAACPHCQMVVHQLAQKSAVLSAALQHDEPSVRLSECVCPSVCLG